MSKLVLQIIPSKHFANARHNTYIYIIFALPTHTSCALAIIKKGSLVIMFRHHRERDTLNFWLWLFELKEKPSRGGFEKVIVFWLPKCLCMRAACSTAPPIYFSNIKQPPLCADCVAHQRATMKQWALKSLYVMFHQMLAHVWKLVYERCGWFFAYIHRFSIYVYTPITRYRCFVSPNNIARYMFAHL